VLIGAPIIATAELAIDAPATYTPGDLLTITLRGDSDGREAIEMLVELTFDTALQVASRSAGDLEDSVAFEAWSRISADLTCGDPDLLQSANQCVAVQALSFNSFPEVPIDLLPSTLSTWQFDTTNARGDLVFLLDPWDREGVSHDHFFFEFPGAQITVAMIPEPSTALLLGIGLAMLASRRACSGC
jgi:hypothetical protein